MEVLQEENREMKQRLEEMRFGKYGDASGGGKKAVPVLRVRIVVSLSSGRARGVTVRVATVRH